MAELVGNPLKIEKNATELNSVENGLAIVVDGNKSSVAATKDQYVLVKNSTINGITDGGYKAAKAISANTALDSSYLTAISTGVTNDILGKLTSLETRETLAVTMYATSEKQTILSTATAYKYNMGKFVFVHCYLDMANKTIAAGKTPYIEGLRLYQGASRLFPVCARYGGSTFGLFVMQLEGNSDTAYLREPSGVSMQEHVFGASNAYIIIDYFYYEP